MATSNKLPKGTIVLFISFLLLLSLVLLLQQPKQPDIPKDLMAVLRPYVIPLKDFTLVDHNEQDFKNINLKDKWSFVFFGYTHCPDICPTTLVSLKHIYKALKKYPQAENMQVIFVSVDPERDNAKVLGKYVKYFNKNFIALTGSTKNINQFAKQFSAAYFKDKPTAPGEYLVSHASSIFLVNPKTNIVASFSPPHSPATITSQYLKIQSMH